MSNKEKSIKRKIVGNKLNVFIHVQVKMFTLNNDIFLKNIEVLKLQDRLIER